ncbi:MAG: hypothetical protein OHK0022_40570 [Roseiflexaceae bacterium]
MAITQPEELLRQLDSGEITPDAALRQVLMLLERIEAAFQVCAITLYDYRLTDNEIHAPPLAKQISDERRQDARRRQKPARAEPPEG